MSAWLGAFLARALLDWVLGVDGVPLAVGILVAGALGAWLGMGEARRLRPFEPAERRDAVLGWGALVGAVACIACLLLPMPWGALAALAVLALTVALLRGVSVRAARG